MAIARVSRRPRQDILAFWRSQLSSGNGILWAGGRVLNVNSCQTFGWALGPSVDERTSGISGQNTPRFSHVLFEDEGTASTPVSAWTSCTTNCPFLSTVDPSVLALIWSVSLSPLPPDSTRVCGLNAVRVPIQPLTLL